jgi:Ca2+-binding EF-hand superfamily protein
MDEDHSKTINMAEFKIGIADHGLTFSKPEIEELFRAFDTNNSGSIDYEEFLFHLRVCYTI